MNYYSQEEVRHRLGVLLAKGVLVYNGEPGELKFDTIEFALNKILEFNHAAAHYTESSVQGNGKLLDYWVANLSSESTGIRTMWATGPAMIIPYIYGYSGNYNQQRGTYSY